VIKYRYLDDVAPADCAFIAYGKTLEELFANAALAVTGCMVEPDTVAAVYARQIQLVADSCQDLLYNWLEEIIFLKDAERLFLVDFEVRIEKKEPAFLTGTARGDKIDYKKQRIHVDVKAVTMHRFNLEQTQAGWEAFVVLDL